jgi:hypothetical protein
MLLEDRPDSAITQYYVREMYQTIRCDHLYDMSEMRSAFEEHLEAEPGEAGPINRIRQYQALATDEERALQTLRHYWSWHRSMYRAAIPYHSQLYYYSWYQAEKLFAAIGVVSTALLALKKTPVIVRIIRAQRKGTETHYIGASSSSSASHPRLSATHTKTCPERNVKGCSQNLSTV